MYFILRYESFSDNAAAQLGRAEPPYGELEFDCGVEVADPPKLLRLIMTREEKGDLGDYVPTGLPGLVISGAFRKALEDCGARNVQYVPIQIEDTVSGEVHVDYFVANILSVIDCIDLGRSKLVMRAAPPGAIRFIKELHLNESALNGATLFRLARKESLILVSEGTKDELASRELRGLGFVPAEGYQA